MLGDNLGSHFNGGFITSFRGTYFCRYCPISKENFSDNPTRVEKFRDATTHEKYLKKVSRNKELSSFKGNKSRYVLNSLPYFNICNPGLPPCCFHGYLTGVFDYDGMLIIKYLIKEGWFTMELINRRIKHYKFCFHDAINKPNPLKIIKNVLVVLHQKRKLF